MIANLLRWSKYLLGLSALLLVTSFFLKNRLPGPDDLAGPLAQEPRQSEVDKQALSVEKQGKVYTIQPLYAYDLAGLVVSAHDSRGWLDFAHGFWGDELNVKDLCVIWGGNASHGIYQALSFSSGDWTCYAQGTDDAAWQAFNMAQLSNNHLLAVDPALTERIAATEVGDQVRFKGYLASYTYGQGKSRGTSTRRDDTGEGACETVYVEEYEVLQRGNPFWRDVFATTTIATPALLLAFLVCFFWDIFAPDPRDPELFWRQGLDLAAQGKLKPALAALDRSIALDPTNPTTYRDRASLRETLGDPLGADSDRKRAERLEAWKGRVDV